MSSDKNRSPILDDIKKIQDSLKEKNEAQRGAINLQLVGIIDMLKKHILDKQKKLDSYVEKLQELTNDDIAKSLLDSLNIQLNDTGDDYATLLKFESENKTPSSDAKNLGVLLQISSTLGQLILRLQSIEDALDAAVDTN